MTKKRKNSRSPTISPTYISTSSKAVPSPLTTNQEHNLFDSPNRISEFLQYEPVQFDSPKLLERQHSITSTRRSSTFSPRISLWQDSIINNSNVDTSLLNLDSPKEKVKTVPPSPIQEKKEPELKNTTSIKAAVKPTVNNGNNSQSGWKCQMCSCPEHQTPLKRKGPDGKRSICNTCYSRLRVQEERSKRGTARPMIAQKPKLQMPESTSVDPLAFGAMSPGSWGGIADTPTNGRQSKRQKFTM